MCVIVVKEPGQKMPSDKFLAKCLDKNPHGFGYGYVANGKLIWDKGLWNLKQVLEALGKVPDESRCVIHFRFATSRDVNRKLCHPFVIRRGEEVNGGEGLFFHNGIFNIDAPLDSSDTEQWVRFYNAGLRWVLKPSVVMGSRLAFMDSKGEVKYQGSWTESLDDDSGEIYKTSCEVVVYPRYYGYQYVDWDIEDATYYDEYVMNDCLDCKHYMGLVGKMHKCGRYKATFADTTSCSMFVKEHKSNRAMRADSCGSCSSCEHYYESKATGYAYCFSKDTGIHTDVKKVKICGYYKAKTKRLEHNAKAV